MWESVTRKPSRQVRMLGVEPATPVMLGAYNQTMCTVKGDLREDLFRQKVWGSASDKHCSIM